MKSQLHEHILVCLSTAPSNANIIRTAAKMADAFQGSLTALYVETKGSARMGEEDRQRLQKHTRLAEKLGAVITTVTDDDVAYQIAEFARLSKVTKVVIGRSNAASHGLFPKKPLTERLIELAPSLDIYIIPDMSGENTGRSNPSVKEPLVPFLQRVFMVLSGLLLFDYLFLQPRFHFHIREADYPLIFAIVLVAALITGAWANQQASHAKKSSELAWRTKVLMETNQHLQKAADEQEILQVIAAQLMKLLNRSLVLYPVTGGKLGEPFSLLPEQDLESDSLSGRSGGFVGEEEIAEWVFVNQKRAGASTEYFSQAEGLYLAIRSNEEVFGVVGLPMKNRSLAPFENSVLLSVLGEGALAMESHRNAREKEEAAVLAKNEQLRANLLRSISHDLRTPLTSISGNAENLLANDASLSESERKSVLTDIYDDSIWLIRLVENLLAITKIGDGRIGDGKARMNLSTELMDEVITESLRHICRRSQEHVVETEFSEELLLAQMDARLISQVIVNLVDNAMKYTPAGSVIRITADKEDNKIRVSVADNGPGIPDTLKPKAFEMFFTGETKVADCRRSMGLGLALCRSIVSAHGGDIRLTDNQPSGCVFTFTLPASEVTINES